MITCPRCQKTSHHPEDEAQGYCNACHWWTSDPQLGAPEVIAQAEREGAILPLQTITTEQLADSIEKERAADQCISIDRSREGAATGGYSRRTHWGCP